MTFYLALDYETMTKYGAWGHIHELNHHFQKFGFYSTSNEVTNNIINLVEYILYSQISGLRNEFSNAAITKISGNHNYLNPEYSLKLLVDNPPTSQDEIRFYDPILIAFGPELFIKVTQYGQGSAGVDLFYESLVEVLHYDFAFYIENILNLVISPEKKATYQTVGYPVFIPVSSIYQTGRYFTIDNVEYFSNTSFPYRIPPGGPTKLDFENHIIVLTGFTYSIQSISPPTYGTLEKLSDKVYTYIPNDEHSLSGRIKLKLLLSNTAAGISSEVTLGLEFEIDSTQSVQTNYIVDSVIYTDLETAMENNYEGYSSKEYLPNFSGALTGIKEGNIGIWEGKFKIDQEGYKYILYKGGRGPSFLYAKINNETEYKKIGYILTNQHVVSGATTVNVVANDSSDEIEANVLGGDEYLDLAVLRIAKKDVRAIVEIGSSEKLKLGDSIFTIGAPMGVDYKGSVTSGVLSGKDRMVSVSVGNSTTNDWVMRVLQIDASINPGNSGGPLLNVNGEVIGVCSMKLVDNQIEGMGFAIPIEYAMNHIEALENGKKIEWPVLGIAMINVSDQSSLYRNNITIDKNIKEGVVIASVSKGSAADKAGLEQGDVIIKIDGNKVTDSAYLRYMLYQHSAGDTMKATIIRKGHEKEISIKL